MHSILLPIASNCLYMILRGILQKKILYRNKGATQHIILENDMDIFFSCFHYDIYGIIMKGSYFNTLQSRHLSPH